MLMNFNIESHAASIVEDIYSNEFVKNIYNMIPIHVLHKEPRRSMERRKLLKYNRKKVYYIISPCCPLNNNNNTPTSPPYDFL